MSVFACNAACTVPLQRLTEGLCLQEVLGLAAYDGKAADVWSCGVHLYVMLCGAYPFDDPQEPGNIRRIVQNITLANYSWPADPALSCEAKHLVDSILVPEADRRITIDGIVKHPWYLQNLPDELRVCTPQPFENLCIGLHLPWCSDVGDIS